MYECYGCLILHLSLGKFEWKKLRNLSFNEYEDYICTLFISLVRCSDFSLSLFT